MEAKLYLIAALFSQHILRIQSVSILCKERAKREQSEGKERARRGKPLFALSLPSLWSNFTKNE